MSKENSPPRATDVTAQLRLLQAASEGKLDGLTCPNCEEATVSVYFTHPAPKEYRTWFVCGNCDFSTRAQNSEMPEYYSTERDRTGKAASNVP
jgi:transcription elongation factor Elf1